MCSMFLHRLFVIKTSLFFENNIWIKMGFIYFGKYYGNKDYGWGIIGKKMLMIKLVTQIKENYSVYVYKYIFYSSFFFFRAVIQVSLSLMRHQLCNI